MLFLKLHGSLLRIWYATLKCLSWNSVDRGIDSHVQLFTVGCKACPDLLAEKLYLVASLLFSMGELVTSQAPDLTVFLVGRAISGVGGAGIMTISFILVLELSGKKRRGLFIGLVNSGFTTGVSLGAVIAGALVNVRGWVGLVAMGFDISLMGTQRFLFWIQTPLAIMAGIGIFFSIPKSFTSGYKEGGPQSIATKLAKIDYLGAVTLVGAFFPCYIHHS